MLIVFLINARRAELHQDAEAETKDWDTEILRSKAAGIAGKRPSG